MLDWGCERNGWSHDYSPVSELGKSVSVGPRKAATSAHIATQARARRAMVMVSEVGPLDVGAI